MSIKSKINYLLEKNKNWSKSSLKLEQNYFTKHAKTRDPKYIWIGCSDSRVSPEQIMNLGIGEIFVHRGIGNIIDKEDISLMAFIYFGIYKLNIRHIIICGHYHCGLVDLSLEESDNQVEIPFVEKLKYKIDHIKDINIIEFNKIKSLEAKSNFLVQKNIEQQVKNFKNLDFIQPVLKELEIHGLVYDVSKGLLKEDF